MSETKIKTTAPRRIVHTENSLGWGGQEIRVFTELRAMQARGHAVWLAAPPRAQIFSRAKDAGIAVVPLDDRKIFYPLTILRLANFFRRERVDVVNTHSSRDGWLGGIAARLARVRLIIRSRHIEVDYPNRCTSRIAFHRLPHRVLTTSRKISERLIAEIGLDAARVTTLPTGIDLERFNAGVHGVLHHELKLPPSTPLVGMVSVLRSWKGHKFFIEAAAEVLRRQPDARFVIVGDGPGRERIANQIAAAGLAGKVVMLGHRDDVPGVLASLSVLVLPSTAHEGVPQIILQAQAMDRAAVGTTVGGIPEVVRDGETGLLVPPQDGAALAEKILLLLAQPDFSHQLGRAAGECARRECGLDAMCARLEEIYAAQLDGRGAAQA